MPAIYSMRFLQTLALLPAAVACAAVHAQTPPAGYPVRPIRIIIGSQPGGGADIVARAFGQYLTERWGRAVVVDNRGGGNGVIAMELLAQAAPDGYTLFAARV
jgi:tripartite-type tricarboxylate transporter receptor subunit TctC